MAEDMQSGVCSGNWWMRSGTGGGYAGTSASPCSAAAAVSEMGSFSWSASDVTEMKGRSGEESVDNHSASLSVGSSMVFQEAPHKADTGGVAMDSSLQLVGFGLSSSAPAPAPDWSHALMRGAGRAESSLQTMLQDEDLNSRTIFRQSMPSGHFQRDWATGEDSNINSLKQIHQHNLFGLEQRLNSGECSATGRSVPVNNMGNYGYPPPMMQGYVDQESQLLSMPSMNYRLNSQPLFSDEFPQNWSKFPQFLRQSSSSSSPPKQQINTQLQFANNGPFWNATTTMAAEIRPTLYASSPSQFLAPTMEEKPSLHNIMVKRSCEETGDASSSDLKKSSTPESTFKRPRLDTPSPLPTFKVRKEKLGDRITALQQLVSPFGKTDTASVLHEAIQYIKFLHDQVNNSDKSKDQEGPKQDLRSRGLCLVPISSTFVNNETAADFWTPTFGGHYR
ncbi:Transcription factor [Nymphaea thermarum]|nr:Transcription factor [Nymphaea thermarum]